MKRLVSLLLVLAVVFTAATAMAETVTVQRGDTLTMDVEITSAGGEAVLIGIDTKAAPVTCTNAVGVVGSNANDTVPPQPSADGTYDLTNQFFAVVNIEGVSFSADGKIPDGGLDGAKLSQLVKGKIGTLTFKVNDDAAAGSYTVEAFVETVVGSGSVTVEGSLTFTVEVPEAGDRVPGDANEDGMFDIIDLLMCLQKEAGWEVTINEDNADVNRDGMFDIIDLLMMLQKEAGWDVELL